MTHDGQDLWRLGDVALWVEQQSSIQLKAITDHGDPVELSPHEARQVARVLLEFAEKADQ